uniref:Uncharacterized protein n=1 Tax=Rhizophora mucronata TaxID=61149 RepID=A0A2P2IMC2_RHIMU
MVFCLFILQNIDKIPSVNCLVLVIDVSIPFLVLVLW